MNESPGQLYAFGPFHLDAVRRVLRRDSELVALKPKVCELLLVLIEQRDRVMDKDELMQRLWPDTAVEENNLTVNMSALRKALGESASEHRYIVTVPGRGYRFVASVKEMKEGGAAVAVQARSEAKITLTEAAPMAIAVLPFQPLGVESGDEYLGFGLADALITRLSNLRQISVRPTSAVRKYLGQTPDTVTVGRELQVEAVLEGSLRRADERIRVTVQLVKVSDGRPLWAAKFDERFSDIFTVEDSVSEQVSQALLRTLTGEERARLTKRYTENTEAYQLYLQGRYHAGKWTLEGFQKGIACFEQAIQMDRAYALAYCGWADAYILLWSHGYLSPREAVPKAKAAIVKALELDDALAEAHASLGLMRSGYEWDWAGAERSFIRALELQPHQALTHDWYALYLKATGRHAEAIAHNQRAQELDPLSPWLNATLAWAFYYAGQYDRALAQCQKALEIEPRFGITHWTLGVIYLAQHKFAEAIAALEEAMSLGGSPNVYATLGYAYAVSGRVEEAQRVRDELQAIRPYVPPYEMAVVATGLGEVDEAFEWLEQALIERAAWLAYLNVSPLFDGLRADERFTTLLERIGLTP